MKNLAQKTLAVTDTVLYHNNGKDDMLLTDINICNTGVDTTFSLGIFFSPTSNADGSLFCNLTIKSSETVEKKEKVLPAGAYLVGNSVNAGVVVSVDGYIIT